MPDQLADLPSPARRALHAAGISRRTDLKAWTADELAPLHGIGPKTIEQLRPMLAAPPPAPPGTGATEVDAYLASTASPHAETLVKLRSTLRTILPYAIDGMKYAMPAFILDGKGVAGYAAFKNHCSYFPMSGTVIDAAGDAIAGYEKSKGGIRFPADRSLPTGLVRRLVKLRLEEISAVEDGRRSEYYPDGGLKAAGRMKAGELHGQWKWFRSDGTLMRTGRFASGAQVGTWTTWNRDGTAGTTTSY